MLRKIKNFYQAFVYAIAVLIAEEDLTDAEYLEDCFNLDPFHPVERNWR